MTKPDGNIIAMLAAGVIGVAIVGICICVKDIFDTVES